MRKKPRKLHYVASPYSHEDPSVIHLRIAAVQEFCAQLADKGVFAYSPIAHWGPIALHHNLPHEWRWWREFDLNVLHRCDKLIVLRLAGWDKSTGVKAEIEYARSIGIPVSYRTFKSMEYVP